MAFKSKKLCIEFSRAFLYTPTKSIVVQDINILPRIEREESEVVERIYEKKDENKSFCIFKDEGSLFTGIVLKTDGQHIKISALQKAIEGVECEGLDKGECTEDDIDKVKSMVPKSLESYVEQMGRGISNSISNILEEEDLDEVGDEEETLEGEADTEDQEVEANEYSEDSSDVDV